MLRKIVETKQEEVARLKAATTQQKLLSRLESAPEPRPFRRSLLESTRPVSVIAEVKKASPSKGVIRADFDPLTIASRYTAASVEAISVLTDETYFQGSLAYLEQITQLTGVPVLRKDFLIDEWQLIQSRAHGADCILLIAAILDREQLHHFSQMARQLGMDTLIEVHNREELELVLDTVHPALLGINNRNLHTFETNLSTTAELMPLIPQGIPVVSESGVSQPEDIAFLQQIGVRAVLVGEHFMRQKDITQAVQRLVGERAPDPLGSFL
ncbi:indole-3-glycerol phosphate synthase TrpC [Brevibacillus humidisoli]|uniref:indole-3-glycerol phosphate synthase TrpC n=1 Tax=Brevibacillus humidisoli TaxID=2895522 RepID=UPI001E5DA4D5|nr:indole-3-glycerol phosphate synthase TrpC [Brevibacillus humidisoli]UFJ42773.1 indole-3-glycerol phosphate synthase TrpC [Brevibacillus humidisoli]